MGSVACTFGAGIVHKNGQCYSSNNDTIYYNRDSALYFIEKAANLGYAPAMYEMGLSTLGVNNYNLASATKWLQ